MESFSFLCRKKSLIIIPFYCTYHSGKHRRLPKVPPARKLPEILANGTYFGYLMILH